METSPCAVSCVSDDIRETDDLASLTTLRHARSVHLEEEEANNSSRDDNRDEEDGADDGTDSSCCLPSLQQILSMNGDVDDDDDLVSEGDGGGFCADDDDDDGNSFGGAVAAAAAISTTLPEQNSANRTSDDVFAIDPSWPVYAPKVSSKSTTKETSNSGSIYRLPSSTNGFSAPFASTGVDETRLSNRNRKLDSQCLSGLVDGGCIRDGSSASVFGMTTTTTGSSSGSTSPISPSTFYSCRSVNDALTAFSTLKGKPSAMATKQSKSGSEGSSNEASSSRTCPLWTNTTSNNSVKMW